MNSYYYIQIKMHLNKAKDNIIANIPFNLVPHLRETLLNDKQIDESPKKQCEN